MRNLIILDLDGTLIDSRDDLALAVNLTRQDHGLAPLAVAVVSTYVGEGLRVLIQRAMPERPEKLEEAILLARRHYAAHLLDRTVLYPGVAEALAELTAMRYPLAILTNKPQEFTEVILDGLRIAPLFAAVLGGRPGARMKPDPAPILDLLASTHTAPDDSWMVGDHFTDLEAGRRAGVRRCFCRYGFGNPASESWDLAVDDLRQLAAHLRHACPASV